MMAAIPEPQHDTAALIDQHHEAKQDPPRPHLGGSLLGHPCERWLWLSFRWAVQERFPGRIKRLFRRGQNEEDIVVSDLKAIGVKVTHTGKNQMRLDFGKHVAGSVDGICEDGVPMGGMQPHLLEIKTHALKSFDDLCAKGVEASKPQHWAQMQVYMHGAGVERALYFAVCKNDDRIYTERVKYDKAATLKLIERGHRVTMAERMPDPLSTDPSWYQCKFCPAHAFCHEGQPTQHVNCRTCAHATPMPHSTWRCERHDADNIPEDFQRQGCDDHVLHPDLVPWGWKPSDDPNEAVYVINGVDVRNGHADAYVFASSELIANPAGCTDALAGKVRRTFGAKVTG